MLTKNGALNEIKAGCDESDRSSRAISLADLEGSSHESLVLKVSEAAAGTNSLLQERVPLLGIIDGGPSDSGRWLSPSSSHFKLRWASTYS